MNCQYGIVFFFFFFFFLLVYQNQKIDLILFYFYIFAPFCVMDSQIAPAFGSLMNYECCGTHVDV